LSLKSTCTSFVHIDALFSKPFQGTGRATGKHNEANGENNKDGNSNNRYWNCVLKV